MILWVRRRRKGEIDYLGSVIMRVWLKARLRSILEALARREEKSKRSKKSKRHMI